MLRENGSPGATIPGANTYDDTLPNTTRVARAHDIAQQLQLINLAARLVAEIGDRAEREARIATAAWRAGYRAGFAAGEDVGYGRAHEEIAEAWREVAEHVRAYGRPGLDPYHELRRRRYQPGGEAYLAALARRGGREYTGGPVQWDVPVGGAA